MTFSGDAFNDYAKAKRRKFGRSRSKLVGASEVGQCIRKIGYLKHDDPKDSNVNPKHVDNWGASRRGVVIEENFFVPAMRKRFGKQLLYSGEKQQTWIYGALGATPDGLLINQKKNVLAGLMVPDIGPSGEIVIDCKTIDPRINLSEPKPEHVFQVQTQMGVLRHASKHRPDYGLLIYLNASFLDDVIEFVVRYDPEIFVQAQKRAAAVFAAAHAEDLEPEGWIDGGKECDHCQFSSACRAIRGNVPQNADLVASDPQFAAELFDLANVERACHAQVELAQAAHRAAQEKIKVALRTKGLNRMRTHEMSITWSSVVGRPSFDMPKLKDAAVAAGFDLQRFERVGQPTDRLLVQITRKDRLIQK